MTFSPFRHRLRYLSLERKLALIVALFGAIVATLVLLAVLEIEILAAVRAYVGGEGLWSKSQKTAVTHLQRYATSKLPREYEAFRTSIAVPLGDRRARLALEQPTPDLEAARRGFLAGRNHPDDVPGLIELFRRLRHVPLMAGAIDMWTAADARVVELAELGERIHDEIASGHPDPRVVRAMIEELDRIDAATTPYADAFSADLATGARSLKRSVLAVIEVAGALLLSIGALLSWSLVRRIRESERSYRHLLDTANDAILMIDPESGRVIDANRRAARMFGQPLPLLIGRAAAELHAPLLAPPSGPDPLAESHPTAIEMEIRGAGGSTVPVEVTSAMAEVAGRRVVHSILRDITERRRAERELEESRGRWEEEARISSALVRVGRELISSLDDPSQIDRLCRLTAEVLECDVSRTWLLDPASDVFVARGGVSDAERAFEEALPAMPRDALRSLLERLERDGVIALDGAAFVELGFTPAGGCDAIGAGLVAALRRGDEILGFQTACRLGAARGFDEAQIRIAHGIRQLASMELENAHLLSKLDAANRIKSEFVATMSHELRTPLNIIVGYASLLGEEAFDPLTPAQADTVWRIERAADELCELVAATLDMSRFQVGEIQLLSEVVRIDAFLGALSQSLQLPRDKAYLTLSWRVEGGIAPLRTDSLKLKMVIKNLVRNAIKYTDHGGVTVSARATGGGVEIAVRDTGIGIPPEARSVIFEAFRQAAASDEKHYGGVGLGLYIAHRVVTAMGGTIAVESEVGKGSCFRVWLPATMRVGESSGEGNARAEFAETRRGGGRAPAAGDRSGMLPAREATVAPFTPRTARARADTPPAQRFARRPS
jgi:PAS domain S-box-containing protein